MDKDRKRELKRLGKKIVENRSAQVEQALRETNPLDPGEEGWAENYRHSVLLEREIKANTAHVIPASAINVHVVLLEDPDSSPSRSRIAAPGIYVQCSKCKDLIPCVTSSILTCHCGEFVHGPSPPGYDLRHLQNREFSKVLGKGISGQPGHKTKGPTWWKFWNRSN